MSKKMNTLLASLAAVAAMAVALPAAAAPTGFAPIQGPQGFELSGLDSIAAVKADGRDEQVVVLKGRFTKQLTKEKFEFTDARATRSSVNSTTTATGR